MWVSDLAELVEQNRENTLKLLEVEHGIKVTDDTPTTLIETLEATLDRVTSIGVTYNDVMFIRNHTAFKGLSCKLNPNHYSAEPRFNGLSAFKTVVMACLKILRGD